MRGNRFLNREQIAWILVDWGNSAFATTIMAAVLPVFYKTVAGANLPNAISTSYWAYTNFIAALLIAMISPVLGTVADVGGLRKRFFYIFWVMGTISTFFLSFTGNGDYFIVSVLYILGAMGFTGSEVFYNSFLHQVAEGKDRDRISSYGYAAGYLGGGVLLAVNILMISKPSLFGIRDKLMATKLSFATVSIWWIVFVLPFAIIVKEKITGSAGISIKSGVYEIFQKFKELRKYPDAFKFLIAFWLYNDGIGTIIKMAVAYGTEIGINTTDLIAAILITQFVGIPFTILFGHITRKLKTKHAIFIGLMVYMFITFWGFFMKSAMEFYILAILVGTVQGGTQALSRSLFANLVPEKKSAQFFGLFALSAKFSTILGPFLFGLVTQLTGHGRYAIFSLMVFFVGGGLLLLKVKEGVNG